MIIKSPFFCLMEMFLPLDLFLCIDAKNKIDKVKCFYCIVHFKYNFGIKCSKVSMNLILQISIIMLEKLHEPLKHERST
jgi:hypothetical protein